MSQNKIMLQADILNLDMQVLIDSLDQPDNATIRSIINEFGDENRFRSLLTQAVFRLNTREFIEVAGGDAVMLYIDSKCYIYYPNQIPNPRVLVTGKLLKGIVVELTVPQFLSYTIVGMLESVVYINHNDFFARERLEYSD